MTEAKAPSPAQFDKLCAQYAELEAQSIKAAEKLAAKDAEIMAIVNQWGSSPDGAEKSLRFEGAKFQATSIGGVNTSIDETGVLQLKLALVKAHCGHLFKKFFLSNSKFTLAPGATEALAELPAKAPKNLATLFHSCLSFKPKKPRLVVSAIAAKAKAAR